MVNHERSYWKQPLLLLSGLLCDETVWAEIPERLGDAAEVRVISFGRFSSIPEMAEHVLAVAPERFAIAGHSMGGRVALEVIRTASQRITALACSIPACMRCATANRKAAPTCCGWPMSAACWHWRRNCCRP